MADIRELLADILNDARVDGGRSPVVWGYHRLLADLILEDPRIAVVALPAVSPNMCADQCHRVGVPDENPVYLSREGVIQTSGRGYYNTAQGDNPEPFAAAMIAAHRHATAAVRDV